MLIKFYYFSAVRSTDTADTATATHYVPILHIQWLRARQFSSNNAQLLWLVQFYCGVAGTGAGPGPVPGSYLWSFVTTWHLFGSQQSRASPCSPDPLLSLRVTADSPTVIKYFCVHKIFVRNLADNAAITEYQVLDVGRRQGCLLRNTELQPCPVHRCHRVMLRTIFDCLKYQILNCLFFTSLWLYWWLESKVKSV